MSTALDEYHEVSPKGTVDFLYRLSDLVKGRSIVHVNAVRYGGGAAELLRRLVPMMTALGIEARWEVIAGTQEYFTVVKRLTNALQGRDERITEEMYQTFREINERNAKALNLEADMVKARSAPGEKAVEVRIRPVRPDHLETHPARRLEVGRGHALAGNLLPAGGHDPEQRERRLRPREIGRRPGDVFEPGNLDHVEPRSGWRARRGARRSTVSRPRSMVG